LPANDTSVVTMPRPKPESGEPAKKKPERKTAPVQIDAELARMAAVIAAHDKKNIADIINPLIRQWLLTNYERVQKEIQQRIATMRAEDRGG
jgi:hypothetical protein